MYSGRPPLLSAPDAQARHRRQRSGELLYLQPGRGRRPPRGRAGAGPRHLWPSPPLGKSRTVALHSLAIVATRGTSNNIFQVATLVRAATALEMTVDVLFQG